MDCPTSDYRRVIQSREYANNILNRVNICIVDFVLLFCELLLLSQNVVFVCVVVVVILHFFIPIFFLTKDGSEILFINFIFLFPDIRLI